ncbi:MAG: cation-translocating P-type ATPase, partial [Rhodothermia bacterium]|nr:cation-translocating P-type ATPase [Rhodothermia bacterium]
GYRVPAPDEGSGAAVAQHAGRRVLWLFSIVFATVLLVVIAVEWLGLIDPITDQIPLPVGVGLVILIGYPVLRQVVLAGLKGRVISHTLMAVGAAAALFVGEWPTAVVVVFFMRLGEYAERFTVDSARKSVKSLTEMAPRTARVERGGVEREIPASEVRPGEVVVVRPGELIAVDGTVIGGVATIDQAAITGEGMPVEAGEGASVYAATVATLGALRIRAEAVGKDTTFGRVIRMVEDAEAHRGHIQRMADRFSSYYLPVVIVIAIFVYLLRQDVMATIAVLVVACSCAFALATPVAILASVGAAARKGLLVKGGKYLELLDKATVLLIDKTGTLTQGRPVITDLASTSGATEEEILHLAASAEMFSEHPLAAAVRLYAAERGVAPSEPEAFEALPGLGVRATVRGRMVSVGSRRLSGRPVSDGSLDRLAGEGKTVLFVEADGALLGVLAASDKEREDAVSALASLRQRGFEAIEMLTGDSEAVAAKIADKMALSYRAHLLPEDKVQVVRSYQSTGATVVMIGDGVNDAPALAQADVGIAMGARGSDVAVEVANIAIMGDDWMLVPELFRMTSRTMRVVRTNIGFTAIYNLAGLTLAAFGILPPILAAAAQSFPDVGIMANSARLLRQ